MLPRPVTSSGFATPVTEAATGAIHEASWATPRSSRVKLTECDG